MFCLLNTSPSNRVIVLLIVLKHWIVLVTQWKRILGLQKTWSDGNPGWPRIPIPGDWKGQRSQRQEGWTGKRLADFHTWLPSSGQPAQPLHLQNLRLRSIGFSHGIYKSHNPGESSARLPRYESHTCHRTLGVSWFLRKRIQLWQGLARLGYLEQHVAVLPWWQCQTIPWESNIYH